nr:glycoside hydrolase family 38 C-terminal domain-containing protein [Candidatus Sigynarchaeota archaeon]
MGKDEKIIIVSHTHWDREWYMSFNLFRFRLVTMMDRLVNLLEINQEYKSFMLDGQTSLLEDYLEVRPGAKQRLEALIQRGKIQIGPYYVQNDPWLQTGEGYVRNLLMGHSISRSYGVMPMKIGYIPDQYAHFEQMPQVFRGFNIGAMAFGRGMGNQQEEHGLGFEFEWKAPDGTSVVALHLISGYGQCTGLPDDPDAAINMMLFDKTKLNEIKKSTQWTLLFSGSDHRIPEQSLPAAIKRWNETSEITEDEGTIMQGTIEEFVQNVLAEKPHFPSYSGELRGARYQHSFQGVFSSCMPLKKRNFHAHDVLERYAEPLSIIARCIAGSDYSGFIALAWKELLKNEAHDSAWTASWNQVMKEMDTRFDCVLQNAEETRNWALLDLTSRIIVERQTEQQVEVVLFNPLEFPRSEPVSVTIPTNFELESGYVMMDSTGKKLQATFERVLAGNEEIMLVRKFVGSQGSRPKYFYKVFTEPLEVPALGYTILFINPIGTNAINQNISAKVKEITQATGLKASDTSMENDAVKVEILPNGSFNVIDKATKHAYTGFNMFADVGDVGDGYESLAVPGDHPITTKASAAQRKLVVGTGFAATCKVDIPLEIPACASDDRSKRVEQKIKLGITSYITIRTSTDPRVDVRVEFENNARDHKLSVAFPTGLKAAQVQVDGHFGITSRDIKLPKSDGWINKPLPQAPQHRFVSVTDTSGKKGILIANRGLPEYEATYRDDGTVDLGLTLMRATWGWGWHINQQSPVRVEITQVQGKHACEYSIIPHGGNIFASAFRKAMAFRYPVHAEYRGVHNKYEGHFPNITAPKPFLLLTGSFFELDPPELVLSCVKKAERSDDIIVRLFNASKSKEIQGTLKIGLKIKNVDIVNLEEDVMSSLQIKEKEIASSIVLKVPPAKIITLKLAVD